MSNLYAASRQWFSRPDDERYLTLESLHEAALASMRNSSEVEVDISGAEFVPHGEYDIEMVTFKDKMNVTNWGFNQLCSKINAPRDFIAKLPADLACRNLNFALERCGDSMASLYIEKTPNGSMLKSCNSVTYGRIYDAQLTAAVMNLNRSGRWKIPYASYQAQDPLRATTLYKGDRNVFIFLVDPDNPVIVGNETLFRGFYCWNSEVGERTIGLAMFLYRYVCDNRIIWGVKDFREYKMKHSKMAPERFKEDIVPMLNSYSESSTRGLELTISRAKTVSFAKNEKLAIERLSDKHDFTRKAAETIIDMTKKEEGDNFSVWNVVQGGTAMARNIKHANTRVSFEFKVSSLLDEVSE